MSRPVAVLLLRVALMNIPTKVGAKAWSRCFLLLVQRGDAFGINEAGSPRAKRLYKQLAAAHGYGQFGLNEGPNPIFWNKAVFRFVSGHQIRIHGRGRGRLARRWPGFNGARYVTVVTLRHIDSGRLVTFLNWHLVAPGWKVRRRWRSRMRAKSAALIKRQVTFHRSQGRIVVGLGDANRDAWTLPGAKWLHRDGPDLMLVGLPAGTYLEKADTDTFPAPTDHKHGKSADIELIGA